MNQFSCTIVLSFFINLRSFVSWSLSRSCRSESSWKRHLTWWLAALERKRSLVKCEVRSWPWVRSNVRRHFRWLKDVEIQNKLKATNRLRQCDLIDEQKSAQINQKSLNIVPNLACTKYWDYFTLLLGFWAHVVAHRAFKSWPKHLKSDQMCLKNYLGQKFLNLGPNFPHMVSKTIC